jgi:hypothetical protein
MDTDVVLSIIAGLGLIVLVLVDSLVAQLRPSDTSDHRPFVKNSPKHASPAKIRPWLAVHQAHEYKDNWVSKKCFKLAEIVFQQSLKGTSKKSALTRRLAMAKTGQDMSLNRCLQGEPVFSEVPLKLIVQADQPEQHADQVTTERYQTMGRITAQQAQAADAAVGEKKGAEQTESIHDQQQQRLARRRPTGRRSQTGDPSHQLTWYPGTQQKHQSAGQGLAKPEGHGHPPSEQPRLRAHADRRQTARSAPPAAPNPTRTG